MRLTIKDTTIARLHQFTQDYHTEDVNELIHSALSELVSLRRLTAAGLCRFTPDIQVPLGQTTSPTTPNSIASRGPQGLVLDDLAALLSDD
ncbi:MAG: hypothetical protein AAFO06_22865 [Cyanobacteria bacterium J06597_16]